MNEVTRWVLGVLFGGLFTLIMGGYTYTYTSWERAAGASEALENRITRQLDIIERKIDRVIEQQYLLSLKK